MIVCQTQTMKRFVKTRQDKTEVLIISQKLNKAGKHTVDIVQLAHFYRSATKTDKSSHYIKNQISIFKQHVAMYLIKVRPFELSRVKPERQNDL